MNLDFLHDLRRLIGGRQAAYKQLFKGPNAEIVLEDLARFCRAHDSCFHSEQRVTDNLEGRREVWLRIQNNLQLSEPELWALFKGDSNG